MVQKFILIILLSFLLGCSGNINNNNKLHENSGIKFANGFSLQINDSSKILTVINPWQGAKGVDYKYYFLENSKCSQTLNKNDGEQFTTPLKRIICLSTTHIAFIDKLQKTSSIIGVSGASFVNSANLLARIKSGEVKDVGYDQNLNYELIVSLKPDAVLCYGVGAESVGYLLKLKELGVKLIFIGEYFAYKFIEIDGSKT